MMKPTRIFTLAVAILLSLSAFSDVFTADEYLVINVPKIKSFNFSIGNVTIGNPDICDFRTNRKDKTITLYPKKAGETLLLVFDTGGKQKTAMQISVYPSDPEKLLSQIRELLRNIEGITVNRLDQKIVVDGEVYTQEDKDRIKKVIGDSDGIIDLTTLNSNTERIIAKKIEKEIGLDEVTVRSLKGKFILEGEVYSKEAKARAEAIARLYSDKVMNVLEIREVPKPPSRANTIQVTAHFIELSKNFTKNLNLKFSPFPNVGATGSMSYNPVTSSQTFAGTLSGTIDDILPKINYYKALGVARVIENPTISVKSGSPASISSGTRVGFPVVNAQGAVTMEFQNVGITLDITPYAQGSDIDMAIEVKVSALGSPEISGSVAIDESSIKTQQFVRSGESIVIGGMIRYNVRNIIDKPNTTSSSSTSNSSSGSNSSDSSSNSDMGSLFTLFKSTDYGKQRSQFIIFITPTILKYAKDANQQLKEQFNLYEVYPSGSYKPMNESGGD